MTYVRRPPAGDNLAGLNLDRAATNTQREAVITLAGIIELTRRKIDVSLLTRSSATELIVSLQGELNHAPGARRPRASRRRVGELPLWQRKLILALATDPGDARHGTAHAYTHGRCRCNQCRHANTARRIR